MSENQIFLSTFIYSIAICQFTRYYRY